MAQLRHWRRDIPESNNVDDDELQGKKCIESIPSLCVRCFCVDMLRQYDDLQYIR